MTAPTPTPNDVVQLALGSMKNFVYLFGCAQSGECAVIDPAWDVPRIRNAATERGWKISKVLLTHTHHDHVQGLVELCQSGDLPVFVHGKERGQVPDVATPIEELEDGERIAVGEIPVDVLHTPGHSPGAVCYRAGSCLFTGDTLFVGRTGRMVFAGSSQDQMFESTKKIRKLSPELTIFPGHDYGPQPSSTLAREFETNPFLRCNDLNTFREVADAWERDHG